MSVVKTILEACIHAIALDGREDEEWDLEILPLPKPKTPTLEDCQNKLKVLGWLEDDPLYDVALAIFCEPSDRYREG
ncbi:hypothetical protein Tco_0670736 [Tanacetum coccineum]